MWDWEYTLEVLPQLLSAAKVTVQATLIGMLIALAGGLLLALAGRSEVKLVSRSTGALVQFVRNTPLLVQLYFLFYVLPRYGITFSALTVGIVGLGLHFSTYTSEVYRAGIENVRRGQWEAATALNFSRRDTWTRIILPQAIPPMIPALGNYFIAMFKETPQLAAITVVEMFNRAKIVGAHSFQYLEPFTLVAFIFLALSYPAALLIRRLEVRYAAK